MDWARAPDNRFRSDIVPDCTRRKVRAKKFAQVSCSHLSFSGDIGSLVPYLICGTLLALALHTLRSWPGNWTRIKDEEVNAFTISKRVFFRKYFFFASEENFPQTRCFRGPRVPLTLSLHEWDTSSQNCGGHKFHFALRAFQAQAKIPFESEDDFGNKIVPRWKIARESNQKVDLNP